MLTYPPCDLDYFSQVWDKLNKFPPWLIFDESEPHGDEYGARTWVLFPAPVLTFIILKPNL